MSLKKIFHGKYYTGSKTTNGPAKVTGVQVGNNTNKNGAYGTGSTRLSTPSSGYSTS